MGAKKNPGLLVGGLLSGLVGGIPDLIAGIKENKARKKAEKFKAAALKQVVGGAALGGIVENPEALINAAVSFQGASGISIPPEVLMLPDPFKWAYMGLIALGIVSQTISTIYANKAKTEEVEQ